MAKGFESPSDEIKIQAGVRRLTPSARRGDIHAFADGIAKLRCRYGGDIADEAMRLTLEQYPNLWDGMIDIIKHVSPGMEQELHAKAVEIMVEALEEAGLRLEQHIRVTDEGIGLTKEAVEAIAATGFPQIHQFGEGNDSLEGMGLDRTNGFIHPLSDKMKATRENGLPEDCLNFWAVVSLLISVVQGWVEGNKENCLEMLQDCVGRSAPTADLETLLKRSRYDDRVLLRLCNLAQTGLDAKARAALS